MLICQVPKKRATLDEGDVFILDNGLEIMQWNGAKCNQMEKYAVSHPSTVTLVVDELNP